MAKLHKESYPMPQYESYEDADTWITESQKALDAIPEDKLFSKPYADGYAYYYVVSKKPLVLQHVPFLDAWHLPAAYIRGLRLQDVKTSIQATIVLNRFFDKAQEEKKEDEDSWIF